MSQNIERTRLTVNVNKSLIKKYKLLAVEESKTLGHYVERGLQALEEIEDHYKQLKEILVCLEHDEMEPAERRTLELLRLMESQYG